MSALCRRKRNDELSDEDFTATLSRVYGERTRWALVELGRTVLSRAEEIVQGNRAHEIVGRYPCGFSRDVSSGVRNTDSLRYWR